KVHSIVLRGNRLTQEFLLCNFVSPAPARALKVEKGQYLKVRGKCKEDGASGVVLEECEVLDSGWGVPPKVGYPVGAARPAVRLTDKSTILLGAVGTLLDLNKDFTIEMWVRFPPQDKKTLYLAGDEAWPDMSPEVKVSCSCGWVLRTKPV